MFAWPLFDLNLFSQFIILYARFVYQATPKAFLAAVVTVTVTDNNGTWLVLSALCAVGVKYIDLVLLGNGC